MPAFLRGSEHRDVHVIGNDTVGMGKSVWSVHDGFSDLRYQHHIYMYSYMCGRWIYDDDINQEVLFVHEYVSCGTLQHTSFSHEDICEMSMKHCTGRR